MKGTLFSSAELTARFGHSAHPLNVYQCLKLFSDVDTCSLYLHSAIISAKLFFLSLSCLSKIECQIGLYIINRCNHLSCGQKRFSLIELIFAPEFKPQDLILELWYFQV